MYSTNWSAIAATAITIAAIPAPTVSVGRVTPSQNTIALSANSAAIASPSPSDGFTAPIFQPLLVSSERR